MNSLMLLAVLLDFILPLSGLLYDNLYMQKVNQVGVWRGFGGFWVLTGIDFYVAILSPHTIPYSHAHGRALPPGGCRRHAPHGTRLGSSKSWGTLILFWPSIFSFHHDGLYDRIAFSWGPAKLNPIIPNHLAGLQGPSSMHRPKDPYFSDSVLRLEH